MRSTTDTTRYSGRNNPCVLPELRRLAKEAEDARRRLIVAASDARFVHWCSLDEIAEATGYNRERIRSLTSGDARREAGLSG